jgi:hypothetical protein
MRKENADSTRHAARNAGILHFMLRHHSRPLCCPHCAEEADHPVALDTFNAFRLLGRVLSMLCFSFCRFMILLDKVGVAPIHPSDKLMQWLIEPSVWRRRCRSCGAMFVAQTMHRENLCGACGYDLRGNRSGRCPECGWHIPHMQRVLAHYEEELNPLS